MKQQNKTHKQVSNCVCCGCCGCCYRGLRSTACVRLLASNPLTDCRCCIDVAILTATAATRPPVPQRHRSKGQIDKEDGGRIDDFKERRKHTQDERKVDRRNHNRQIRTAKREEVTQNKRALGKAPHVVVVVGLCGDATPSADVCHALAPQAKFDDQVDPRTCDPLPFTVFAGSFPAL